MPCFSVKIRLKDSDVTWLYGPLHTAVDWAPPPKASTPSTSSALLPSTTLQSTIINSPSSSVALAAYPGARGYTYQDTFPSTSQNAGMKPILKHRSISEMLTSALPPSPLFGNADEDDGLNDDDEECYAGRVVFGSVGADGRAFSGAAGRPPMFHTKSDTNILRRFGKGNPSPRVAAANAAYYSPVLQSTAESSEGSLLSRSRPSSSDGRPNTRLSYGKRSSSSGNLVDLPSASTAISSSGNGFPWQSQPTRALESPASAISSTPSTAHSDVNSILVEAGNLSASGYSSSGSGSHTMRAQESLSLQNQQPQVAQHQKKHISFNAIVEQCIAIEGSPGPNAMSNRASANRRWTASYADDVAPDDDG